MRSGNHHARAEPMPDREQRNGGSCDHPGVGNLRAHRPAIRQPESLRSTVRSRGCPCPSPRADSRRATAPARALLQYTVRLSSGASPRNRCESHPVPNIFRILNPRKCTSPILTKIGGTRLCSGWHISAMLAGHLFLRRHNRLQRTFSQPRRNFLAHFSRRRRPATACRRPQTPAHTRAPAHAGDSSLPRRAHTRSTPLATHVRNRRSRALQPPSQRF